MRIDSVECSGWRENSPRSRVRLRAWSPVCIGPKCQTRLECAIGAWPLLTSLFQTFSTWLANVLSCSTNADRTKVMPPQSWIASSIAILASPVPSKSDRRATLAVSLSGAPCPLSGCRARKLPWLSVFPGLTDSPSWIRRPAWNQVCTVDSAI